MHLASCLVAAVVAAGATSAATPGFPLFSEFAGSPYAVTYDNRSLLLNNDPALFASGVIHPPRFSGPAEWQQAFAGAKAMGLNAIQLYVFANAHQPTEDDWIWTDNLNVTNFIELAGKADLFVNLRIGPYVCAEWDYGGIPWWLGVKDGVRFRCTNQIWQGWMEQFYGRVLNETQGLFAANGGPVVMVQVENELHGADDGYVSWCGNMAHSLLSARNIDVPVLMCNGQSAANTINSCNGNDCTSFAESYGQSGDIFKTKPGIWTENEGGFQIWGESPSHPTSYFWGRTPAEQAFATARWYARGGSWMSFYMLHGGAHFDRWAGAGLTHFYSVDSPICPDGLPHEPKFSHFNSLFTVLKQVAPAVAYAPVQLKQQQPLPWFDPSVGKFVPGTQQYAFVYSSAQGHAAGVGPVAFIESVADVSVVTTWSGINVTMPANSVAIVDAASRKVLWISGNIIAPTDSRQNTAFAGPGLTWESWAEPFGTDADKLNLPVVKSTSPMEAGSVLKGLGQFLYYETSISTAALLEAAAGSADATATLTWEGGLASAWVVLVDGAAVPGGFVDDHGHSDGTHTYSVSVPTAAMSASAGTSTLTILYASLGYSNDMGAGSTGKTKGILGSVKLGSTDLSSNGWVQRANLAGQQIQLPSGSPTTPITWQTGASTVPMTWMRTTFNAPASFPAGSAAALNATGLGRGHYFVNGRDLGRYWNIQRNDGAGPIQTLYHIPIDWLNLGGSNTLYVVDTLGAADAASVSVVTTSRGGPAPATPSGGWADAIVSCAM